MNTPPKLPNTKDWKKVLINQFKFKYIQRSSEIPSNALWITCCLEPKFSAKKRGVPTDLYKGSFNHLFFMEMEKHGFEFGVFSTRHGVHISGESLSHSRTNFKNLSLEDKLKIGKKIRKKLNKFGFKEIIFYYPTPLASKSYFEVLWFSEIPVHYISSIKLLDKLKNLIEKPPYIPNSKEWKPIVENDYNFKYIQKSEEIPKNALWTTSCSKTKCSSKKGYPCDFYLGKYNLLFYDKMNKNNLDYGILSDEYGIHMTDECLDYYDVHPTKLSLEDKSNLGKIIHEKVKDYGFEKIVFYYPSPLQSKPYFEMLWFSKLPVYYISNIKLLE